MVAQSQLAWYLHKAKGYLPQPWFSGCHSDYSAIPCNLSILLCFTECGGLRATAPCPPTSPPKAWFLQSWNLQKAKLVSWCDASFPLPTKLPKGWEPHRKLKALSPESQTLQSCKLDNKISKSPETHRSTNPNNNQIFSHQHGFWLWNMNRKARIDIHLRKTGKKKFKKELGETKAKQEVKESLNH